MGLFSSKQKTKSTQKATFRGWIEPTVLGLQDKIHNIMDADPTKWVAPTSALQTKAFGDVQGLGGWKPYATQAAGMATDVGGKGPVSANASLAQDHSVLDNGGIGRYLDPAVQSYVDATLASYDDNTARQQAQMQAQGAKAGAFGGSRYGIAQGAFQADAGRGRALTEAELRKSAYDSALAAAMGEADRRAQVGMFNAGNLTDISKTNASFQEQQYLRDLQAAGLLGDLSNSIAGNERADVALTGELGGVQRGIASEYSNAEPMQAQLAAQLFGAFPQDSYLKYKNKSTTTSSPGLGNVAAGLASSAAMAFSDRRLKEDIARIGDTGALGLYRFRYIGDHKARIGVMADEVAIHHPEALGPVIGGYSTVDYARLGLAHLVEGD